MMHPVISVLLPAFNAGVTLPACLRSIRRQTEESWECVIVDDGSADDTLAQARRFAGLDRRFVVVTGGHAGIVAALNLGLEHCKGKFVARMDADDLMHSQRLSKQMKVLEAQPELLAVGCHVRMFPRAGLSDGLRAYESWLNRMRTVSEVQRNVFVECPVAHPGLMIRRWVLAELGYRDQGWPEDYDLVLRTLAQGGAVGVVPEKLLLWRDYPTRLWRTSERYLQKQFTACKGAFLAAGFLARANQYMLWGYGATGRALRRVLLTLGKEPAYIVELHPGRVGKKIHGAPVIRPEELEVPPRLPLVVSVAGEEPRGEIREFLGGLGFVEGEDYICAA